MQDRFKFNAVVSGYYGIDTPKNYEEFEPKFYLKNVDVINDGDIGINRDTLEETIKQSLPNINYSEFNQIMQFFEDNSNSNDNELFLTITPDEIIQCTGLKDKNGELIYEGDIVKWGQQIYAIIWQGSRFVLKKDICKKACDYNLSCFDGTELEIIGNIYENPELVEQGDIKNDR